MSRPCKENDFCSPPPTNKCVDACTLNGKNSTLYTEPINIIFFTVCGVQAVCTASLHRPVCYCMMGWEGDPYDKCTKVTNYYDKCPKVTYPYDKFTKVIC